MLRKALALVLEWLGKFSFWLSGVGVLLLDSVVIGWDEENALLGGKGIMMASDCRLGRRLLVSVSSLTTTLLSFLSAYTLLSWFPALAAGMVLLLPCFRPCLRRIRIDQHPRRAGVKPPQVLAIHPPACFAGLGPAAQPEDRLISQLLDARASQHRKKDTYG
ncbi:hypothetical protein GGTG_05950 [Gaeumannomyces tritici R3-111a-1]|uniref:Uncharacterized protein n=1 Tax=Gaeumannomyces tritici (strain R3-111a-1) TaxID=644352 RepID=J3NXE4_GAET3|nr:hypothetical protein GGTG_05950 [Gaeumannomyces tritici R3-111a-1]EJT76026.1 hypothetical protein GGTG_05950 [Gaeumannomyces tritici R3-111a-1]